MPSRDSRNYGRFLILTVPLVLMLVASFSYSDPAPSLCQEEKSDELYAGLPATLPPDYLQTQGFVTYSADSPRSPDGARRPLSEEAVVMGFGARKNLWGPYEDKASLRKETMLEDEWASLPPNHQIKIGKDSKSRVAWEFPAGTQLVHRLYFKDSPAPKLFEFRLMKKMASGEWAYGVYRTDSKTGNLVLITDAQSDKLPLVESSIRLSDGSTLKAHAQHTGTKSCRICHFEPEQRAPCERMAGPCGFVPGNMEVEKTWVANYKKMFPDRPSPFAPARASAPLSSPTSPSKLRRNR